MTMDDGALWTRNPLTLLEFWNLSPGSTPIAQANANARFVVLWCIIATAVMSFLTGGFKPHFFVVGALILAATGVRDHSQQHTVPSTQSIRELKFCETPTATNPMANPMLNDYGAEGKLPACPTDSVRGEIQQSLNSAPIANMISEKRTDPRQQEIADRAFYSLPATTVPNNVENFRRALTGGEALQRRMDHGFDNTMFSRGT